MNTIIPQDLHTIDLARKLAAIDTVEGLRAEAATDDTVAALVNFWGAARVALANLIGIAERASGPDEVDDGDPEDGDGEYDDDEDWEPYCATCNATVGIFTGRRAAWLHFTGTGTSEDPVDLFDAGHEPEVAWRVAGAR